MKRTIIYLLIFMVINNVIGITNAAAADANIIKVELNGKPLVTNVPPLSINGSTFVPMRSIFEALGASVIWEGSTQTIVAQKQGTIIILTVGEDHAMVNGINVPLTQPAQIIKGSTMVPLRFVSESLGVAVEWLPKERKVRLTTTQAANKETEFVIELVGYGPIKMDHPPLLENGLLMVSVLPFLQLTQNSIGITSNSVNREGKAVIEMVIFLHFNSKQEAIKWTLTVKS